jgi:PAS domain S-box-containing protein
MERLLLKVSIVTKKRPVFLDPGTRVEARSVAESPFLHGLGQLLTLAGILLVAALLVLASPTRSAERKNARFERIGLEEGLSQAFITCILQDRRGFMWFGTQEGLNRFDGYEFTVYRHDPEDSESLSHDSVKTILEDSDGVLWVGTDGGGLSRFDPTTETFSQFRHDPDDPSSLSHDNIRVVLQDSVGRIWIGTDGGGLNLLDPASGGFTHYQPRGSESGAPGGGIIRSLDDDPQGGLWVGTDGDGLQRFDPEDETFFAYRHDPEVAFTLSEDRVTAVFVDDQGIVWVGTYSGGLNRFDPATGRSHRFRHDPEDSQSLSADGVRAITTDSRGTLWIATDAGLSEWVPEADSFIRYQHDPTDPSSLSHDRVSALYEDQGSVLWVGTYGGLNKWNTATEGFLHYRHQAKDPTQLSTDFVITFVEDPSGDLWVGTYGGGLNRLDRARGTFSQYRNIPGNRSSLSDDRVMSLHVDGEGVLWVGTLGGGLNRFDRRTGTFHRYVNDPADSESLSFDGVSALYEDREGQFWVGTFGGGLNLLDRQSERFTSFRHDPANPASLSNDRVVAIHEDAFGLLWIGTHGGGLNRLDPESGRFTHIGSGLEHDRSLSSDSPWSFFEDSNRDLWIGTQDGGLNLWRAVDRAADRVVFTHYGVDEGLPSDSIYGIEADSQGRLWLSTNRGLVRFDPVAEDFKTYDTSQGLQSNEFNFGAHLRTTDGALVFGGINGFNLFYPERLRENEHVPPVVLTKFLKFNRPVDFNRPVTEIDRIELGYKDSVIALEYAALDYAAPKKNRYRHRLEGFDKDWVDSGTLRRATYTNLATGHYIFRVQASNNEGKWNEQGVALAIEMAPPPWRTGWAYLFYVVLAGIVLAGLVRFRAREKERAAALSSANTGLRNEIAERRAKEAALKLEKKKAQRYLDVAEVIMVVVDHDERVSLINQKGCRVLGLGEEEILGRNWFDNFVPIRDREQVRRRLKDSEPGAYFEHYLMTKSGEERVIAWHITRLPAEGGGVATLCSGADLTELRKLAQEKEIAESASKAKSQFLANMSHEIRTPLNGVLGMMELLLQCDLEDRERRFADTARRSASHLMSVLNDVLDFSKIEARKLQLESVVFDPRELIEDVIYLFAERAHEKNLELFFEVSEELPAEVRGDPTRLHQILANLIGNAVKFTDEGSVSVVARGLGKSLDKVRLLFEVVDTGVGIEPAVAEIIFESFRQADGSTARTHGGTGLGLSISKELVEMMNGRIGVQSQPGMGSTFWFEIEVGARPELGSAQRPAGFDAEGLRVLVVDDFAPARESLCSQLSAWGVESLGVSEGSRAFAEMRAAASKGAGYDLAILDLEIPDMHGLELVESIRKDPELGSLPVAVLTSSRVPSEREMRRLKIDAILGKPVRQSDLHACLVDLAAAPAQVVEQTRDPLSSRADLSWCRILLAEDSHANQEVVRGMLEGVGCRVDVAENGPSAVKMASRKSYDLVLMDCQMPLLDGYGATRAIRQDEGVAQDSSDELERRLPIVAMTANAIAGDREKCLAAGMDDYLSKPFRQEELLEMVRRWVEPQNESALPAIEEKSPEEEETAMSAEEDSSLGKAVVSLVRERAERPSIDYEVLESIRQVQARGSGDLLDRVIHTYLNTSPELIDGLRQALLDEDAEEVARVAHKIKSSSGMLGATKLASLSQELETLGHKKSLAEAESVLASLETEFETVAAELAAECRKVVCE